MALTFGASIQQGGDILVADGRADSAARWKLPVWLRAELQADLDAAKGFGVAQSGAEGTRRLDSALVQKAYEEGDDLVRKISKWLNSLDEDDNIPAQRAFYGLGPDLPTTFRHEEIEKLLETFVAAQSNLNLNSDAKLSATRLAKVTAILEVIDAKTEGAGLGERADITAAKVKAQDALEASIARVRYFLWASFPQMFKDPLLHSYGFVPRQESATERAEAPTVASGAL